jgi:hypothetical protein
MQHCARRRRRAGVEGDAKRPKETVVAIAQLHNSGDLLRVSLHWLYAIRDENGSADNVGRLARVAVPENPDYLFSSSKTPHNEGRV